MTSSPSPTTLLLGQPRFEDAEAARLHSHGDLCGAWRRVFAQGPKGLAGVHGPFAVAITEPSGRLTMAVDRFATIPLCFRSDGAGARVATRSDVLGHASDIDAQALFDYLYFHCIPAPRTVFAGVQRLAAGHMAVIDQGRADVRPWWTPEFKPEAQPEFIGLREQFRTLLHESVRRHVEAGHPACFLSGGTDSSTIAGVIGQVVGRPAMTFSIGFDAAGYDEMAYARIAAKHFGTRHHEYYVTPEDLVDGIPRLAAHHDQPFGNSSALPAYCCARMAREHGVTRLLAGDGGDELFGGNSRYALQRVFGWYLRVPGTLRLGVLEPLLLNRAARRVPVARKGSGYVEQARLPMPDRLQKYNLLLRLGVAEVLMPDFLALVRTDSPLAQQREVWRRSDAASELDRTLAFDWRYTLADSDLPKVGMSTSMAGIEVAYPMLESELVDFSMRLPTHYKLNGLKLRWFFKEALRGFLPEEVLVKKKQGFGLPFGVWALQHAALNRLAADALGSLGTRGIVQPAFIRTLMSVRLAEHPGYYGEMVWILMLLEHWLQAHAPAYHM